MLKRFTVFGMAFHAVLGCEETALCRLNTGREGRLLRLVGQQYPVISSGTTRQRQFSPVCRLDSMSGGYVLQWSARPGLRISAADGQDPQPGRTSGCQQQHSKDQSRPGHREGTIAVIQRSRRPQWSPADSQGLHLNFKTFATFP